MADPVSAIVGGTALVGSSIYSSNKAKSAAKAGAASADRAAQVQWDMYDQSRQDYAPWRLGGQEAFYTLADLSGIRRPVTINNDTGLVEEWSDPIAARASAMQQFYTDPGYEFQMNEGIKALDRSAASRGLARSGAQEKAITRYGQGVAEQSFGNYVNRLANLAGVGQTATNSLASLGANTATNVGNANMAAGAARASGYNAQAGVVNNLVNQGVGLWGLNQMGYFG